MLKMAIAGLVLSVSNFANAGLIIASGDSNLDNSENFQLFNSLFGNKEVIGRVGSLDTWATTNWGSFATTSATSYSTIQSINSALTADWLILGSGSALSASEFSFLDTFVNNGGNLWVVGEAASYSNINNSATSILNHFNTGMSISGAGVYATGNATAAATQLGGGPNFRVRYSSYINGGTALYADSNGIILSSFETTSVPEPSTLAIFALSIMGLASRRFKKQ